MKGTIELKPTSSQDTPMDAIELLEHYAAGERCFDVPHLEGIDLSNRDLKGADFRGADLRCANLSGADLSGADLIAANLRSANLFGANLLSANLGGANLRCTLICKTTMPDGEISNRDCLL